MQYFTCIYGHNSNNARNPATPHKPCSSEAVANRLLY